MELDINTLTKEQKKQLSLWYNIYINDNNKLITEKPTKKTEAYKQYLKDIAYKKFEKTIEEIKLSYTDSERETFTLKLIEANKIINWETSEFISNLCLEDETQTELANKIISNSEAYQNLYSQAEKTLRETLNEINS